MNFKYISSKCQILFSITYIIRVLYYGVDILVLASSFNDYTLHFHGILIVLLKCVILHAYLLHNWFYFYNGRFAFIYFFKYIQYTDLITIYSRNVISFVMNSFFSLDFVGFLNIKSLCMLQFWLASSMLNVKVVLFFPCFLYFPTFPLCYLI